jgi:hypothetical protein
MPERSYCIPEIGFPGSSAEARVNIAGICRQLWSFDIFFYRKNWTKLFPPDIGVMAGSPFRGLPQYQLGENHEQAEPSP